MKAIFCRCCFHFNTKIINSVWDNLSMSFLLFFNSIFRGFGSKNYCNYIESKGKLLNTLFRSNPFYKSKPKYPYFWMKKKISHNTEEGVRVRKEPYNVKYYSNDPQILPKKTKSEQIFFFYFWETCQIMTSNDEKKKNQKSVFFPIDKRCDVIRTDGSRPKSNQSDSNYQLCLRFISTNCCPLQCAMIEFTDRYCLNVLKQGSFFEAAGEVSSFCLCPNPNHHNQV